MTFVYQFRTSDNVLHTGKVRARGREAAFAKLRAGGVRPIRVDAAPGFVNFLSAHGRSLFVSALVLGVAGFGAIRLVSTGNELRSRISELELSGMIAPRSQLYGDPYILDIAYQNLWRNHLPDVGDAFLALYAVPGRNLTAVPENEYQAVLASLKAGKDRLLTVEKGDLEEVARMKRMVNGMKIEFRQYVEDGGDVYSYAKDLVIRAKAELAIVRDARLFAENATPAEIEERNRTLRAMGLPLLQPRIPEE